MKQPLQIPDRWARVKFRGVLMDNDTKYRVLVMERRLGYTLTCVKGISPYTGPGDPSGTTHDGPALDLAPWDWQNKLREAKRVAFAGWHREPWQGPWSEHEHLVPIGNPNVSASAAQQVTQFLHHPPLDGLAGQGPDPDPWRPSPQPLDFDYVGAVRDEQLYKRMTSIRANILRERDRLSAIRARLTYRAKRRAATKAAKRIGGAA